jgi:hypothetical protein
MVVSPQELLATQFRLIIERAHHQIGRPPSSLIIAVPSHFFAGQRAAVRDAARIAGVDEIFLVNAATAAVGVLTPNDCLQHVDVLPQLFIIEQRRQTISFCLAKRASIEHAGGYTRVENTEGIKVNEDSLLNASPSCYSVVETSYVLREGHPKAQLASAFAEYARRHPELQNRDTLGCVLLAENGDRLATLRKACKTEIAPARDLLAAQVSAGLLGFPPLPDEVAGHNLWAAGRQRDLRLLRPQDRLPAYVEMEFDDPASPGISQKLVSHELSRDLCMHTPAFREALDHVLIDRIAEELQHGVWRYVERRERVADKERLVFRRQVRRLVPYHAHTALILHQGQFPGNWRPTSEGAVSGTEESGSENAEILLWADDVYQIDTETTRIDGTALVDENWRTDLSSERNKTSPWPVKPWSRFYQATNVREDWRSRLESHASKSLRTQRTARFEQDRNTVVVCPRLLQESKEVIDLGPDVEEVTVSHTMYQLAVQCEQETRRGGLHVLIIIDEGGEITVRAAQRYIECEVEVELQFASSPALDEVTLRDLHGRLLNRLTRLEQQDGKSGFDASAHELYRQFECDLRRFVQDRLHRYYGDAWWRLGVPTDVRVKVAVRREESDDELPLLNHSDLADLLQILNTRKNRDKVFCGLLPYDGFPNLVRDLIPIRNTIAHFKKAIENYEIDLIRRAQDELLRAVRKTSN